MPIQDAETIRAILSRVRTIALVGASDKPHRPSHEVMAYLQGRGYRVIPVSPRLAGGQLLGERVYRSLADIPEAIDMADLFLSPTRVPPVVEEAIERRIPVIWMQIGVVHPDSAEQAEQAGLQVVMDRCPKQEIPHLGIPPVEAGR